VITHRTNLDLIKIMSDLELSLDDVANALGLSKEQVKCWVAEPDSSGYRQLSESDLRLLQYSLMTENRQYHLF
jgi:hypothetical protein